MGQYTSYWLYQKYEQRGSQEPIPVYPNIYSINGDGTMTPVVRNEDDTECGYVPPVEPTYRWTNIPITQDYICDECGYVPPTEKKLVARYLEWTTASTIYVDCNDNPTLTSDETKPSGYNYLAMRNAVIGQCVNIIDAAAFYNCVGLSAITIPNSVTSIGNNAFFCCYNLTNLTIPSGVTSIGSGAFYNCSGLTSVTCLATTPPALGGEAFYNTNENLVIYVPCESLENYWTSTDWNKYVSRIRPIPPCDLPKKLVAIYSDGSTREIECNSSSTLTTSETQPSGYQASAMTSAIIGSCVTSFGGAAFYNCSGLTSITMPNSVSEISESAFWGCRSLTSINMPSSVTHIGASAFGYCSNLTSINIPNGVTMIENFTFQGCTGLTSVTIPNSVRGIYRYPFYGCSGLISVTIPDSVTTIGEYAFSGCTSLTSITCLAATPPTLGTSPFDNTNNCPIYVLAESVDVYKSFEGWRKYASRIQPIS